MKSCLPCLALFAAAAFAVQCKADFLFTYQDASGNLVGFTEKTLQSTGSTSTFLFDKNAVSGFEFGGQAPSVCGALASLKTACTGLANATSLVNALFPNDSFLSPGTFAGSNGATVDIIPFSGYLFTYQDSNGNILAFSEPTLEPSGSENSFLFSTGGITAFSFMSNTGGCGAVGSVVGFACTDVNNNLGIASIFPLGSFTTTGTFGSASATVNIVQATAAPEPGALAVLTIAFLAIGIVRVVRVRQAV